MSPGPPGWYPNPPLSRLPSLSIGFDVSIFANDGIALHVHVQAGFAAEQSVDLAADGLLELRLIHARGLRLPVMIRRALSVAAVSSACPAKNTMAVSTIANISARNGAATRANSTAAAPSSWRSSRRSGVAEAACRFAFPEILVIVPTLTVRPAPCAAFVPLWRRLLANRRC
jgi:hypothetical protein